MHTYIQCIRTMYAYLHTYNAHYSCIHTYNAYTLAYSAYTLTYSACVQLCICNVYDYIGAVMCAELNPASLKDFNTD